MDDTLWSDMLFLAVPGRPTAEAVVAALPGRASLTHEGPRRLALAERLHRGDGSGHNRRDFAVFAEGDHTVVCPPGVKGMTGEVDWQLALAEAFGTCFAFCTNEAALSVARFTKTPSGVQRVSAEEYSPPPEPLLGLTTKLSRATEVLGALAQLFSVQLDELPPILRRGTARFGRVRP